MARDELFGTCTVGPAVVVVLKPTHLLDAATLGKVGDALKAFVDSAGDMPFIFDLTRVSYLSSGGLGMLINLERHIAARKGRLRLAGISDELLEIFRITGLDKIFDIHKDLKAAVKACEPER